MLNITGTVSWQYGEYAPAADPDAALHLSLQILETRQTDGSDIFEEKTAPVMQRAVQEQIRSEGDALDTFWAPLAPATVADREKMGLGGAHPMLQRSGWLIDSFAAGDTDHIQEVTADTMDWGSALPYSLYLHTGTQEGYRIGRSSLGHLGLGIMKAHGATAVGMPGRQIINMTEELQNRIRWDFPRALADAAVRAHFEVDQAGEPQEPPV